MFINAGNHAYKRLCHKTGEEGRLCRKACPRFRLLSTYTSPPYPGATPSPPSSFNHARILVACAHSRFTIPPHDLCASSLLAPPYGQVMWTLTPERTHKFVGSYHTLRNETLRLLHLPFARNASPFVPFTFCSCEKHFFHCDLVIVGAVK